ncbi:MAG: cytochrome c [Paraglaciecola sp.]|jgi:cytochrome c
MKVFTRVLSILTFILIFSCQNEPTNTVKIERPHSPWVFRSVMDSMPRMVTLALHDNLWASYHTQTGALYKTWRGGVNFDGAVYTTAHGPQPSSLGNGWTQNQYKEPWLLSQNGKETKAKFQYKGHELKKGHALLKYELTSVDGQKIEITEQPEFLEKEGGKMGFERVFTTKNVPEGTQVILETNVNSIALESAIETDGDFQINNKKERLFKKISGLDLEGKLVLNSNATTRFATNYVKRPLLENTNKIVGQEEEEDLPAGYKLIARNDCKTCHNTYVNTVGPSYKDVAKKYQNSSENVAMLVSKVKNGGGGIWGEAVMTGHPELAESDIKTMIEYIMDLDAETEAANMAKQAVDSNRNLDYQEGKNGISDEDMFPGAVMKVYLHDHDIVSVDEIEDNRKPDFESILPTINLLDADLADLPENFGMLMSGYLKMPANANFVFRLISDDGTKLWINDQLVISHDGPHGADARDGEMALSEGYHPFRLEYYQGAGGKMVSLQWTPYGGDGFEAVPSTVLMHRKEDAPEVITSIGAKDKLPGNGAPLLEVHPSYDLTQARPETFLPKVAGMDFMPDGRLAVSTWDASGAVYLIDNPDSGDESKMTVTKVAEGLAEPLGLKVVDGDIYVLQKQELTKLIDHNGDDIIDEYQTLNNSWTTTGNFHEFAFGLVYKEGWFYGNLAIAILPGGASANPQAADRGKTFRINKETGELQFVASGMRTPNGIGLGVDNEIFVADNQGDWLPSCKIMHLTEGAFFNSYAVNPEFQAAKKPIKQPVVWLPQDEIGNSPTTPLAINDGPYKGQMIHGEVTHGGVKRVFVEKVAGEYQGCVFRFIQGLEAGVNRMVWGPDGGLYIGGVGSSGNWQQYGKLWYGLQRLKFNEKPAFEMLAVRAKTNGIEIEFTEALEGGDGWNKNVYDIQQWWYEPTAEYGGPKKDLENLKVVSASVSDDRKKVFLELEGMKKQHVIYVHIPNNWVSAKGRELWSTEGWYTLNNIPENDLGEVKKAQSKQLNSLSDAEEVAGWKLLFDGKTTDGWRNFKTDKIGSSWQINEEALMLDVIPNVNGEGWKSVDGGDIITDGEYENFELRLDWKIFNCGNSGIMFNVVEDTSYCCVWQTGPEMQVLDNTCHPDAKFDTHRAGDLYDMIACKYETVKPAGRWNQIRLISKNGKVEHWLNGKKVVEYEMHTPKWKEMIANSKFKDMPDFGLSKKGHISLQDHSDRVWYRNIKIKEL